MSEELYVVVNMHSSLDGNYNIEGGVHTWAYGDREAAIRYANMRRLEDRNPDIQVFQLVSVDVELAVSDEHALCFACDEVVRKDEAVVETDDFGTFYYHPSCAKRWNIHE